MENRVLGRDEEMLVVGRFLDNLFSGPAACVLEGDAGIGKTALWRAGVAAAGVAGVRVLTCAPAEVETALAYSSLADLLAGIEPKLIEGLPGPQRAALEVALLQAGSSDAVAGQRAVATATITVLTKLASSTRVLVAVDDVQWLDLPSARVLEFAARRLDDCRVGFLLSVRSGTALPLGLDRSLGAERLDRVRVGPLSAGALHQLIKGRLQATFSRAELLRIHRVSGGNPFYALELALSLLRSGTPVLGEMFPVPDDVRELLAGRLRMLPAGTRETLFFAAAMPNPMIAVVRRAMGVESKQISAWLGDAEAAGVIGVEGEMIRFKHPLFSSAIVAARSIEERQDAHRKLAALASTSEERARHLALCTEEPDGEIAQTVADAAADLRRRGAPESAVELVELAIRLTPADAAQDRDRRALELGYYLMEAGDSGRARSTLRSVADAEGPLRARALLDLAGLDYWGEGSVPAVARCEQALAAAAGDAALEAACHAELAVYCDFDAERSARHARSALDLLDAAGESADPDVLVDALLATTRARLLLGQGLAADLIERAFICESLAGESIYRSRVGSQLGQWLKYVDDFAGARLRLEEAQLQANQEGDESSLPNQLMHLAQLECWSGNWLLAAEYAETSVELAEQVGQGFGGPPAMRALIDVHLGNVGRARETIESRLAEIEGNPMAVALYLRVVGLLELSLGEPTAAARHLSGALTAAESCGIREPAVYRIHADLVEALIAVGDLERAELVLGEFEARGEASRIPWSLATSARCRGLLFAAHGKLDAAEQSFERALVEHAHSPVPFERARTLLALGLLQRRKNERRLADQSLTEAVSIFEDLGAPLWATRARRELRPIGGRPTSRLTLTSAEQRVAELAASGMTNREVAAVLFISAKTVESTLARAYRKLQIHSRAELGARIAAPGSTDAAVRPPASD
jgi:DNA-binding CsgD family transcriptional regulator